MGDEPDVNEEKFRGQNKTAFILGYTGEVGKEVTKALLTSRIFSKVVLIGRRLIKYDEDIYKDMVG